MRTLPIDIKKGVCKAIKTLRSKFTPRFVQMKDLKGMCVKLEKRAETIATYFAEKHWKNEAEGIGNINKWKITEELSNIRGDFTIEELAGALKNAKKRKGAWT